MKIVFFFDLLIWCCCHGQLGEAEPTGVAHIYVLGFMNTYTQTWDSTQLPDQSTKLKHKRRSSLKRLNIAWCCCKGELHELEHTLTTGIYILDVFNACTQI